VTHNTSDANDVGVRIGAGSASYNLISNNSSLGIESSGASYIGNVFFNNPRDVNFGVNLGQNLCSTSACP
jgi:hypothetical protein